MRIPPGISLLLMLAFAPPLRAEPPPKSDIHGEPLPPGAFARFGSTRLRHDALAVGFIDAKTVISVGPTVRNWEVATGRLVQEHRHTKLSGAGAARVSANGRVAVTAHRREEYRVWDLASGTLLREFTGGIAERAARDERIELSVSADGKQFASYIPILPAIRVWRTGSDGPAVRLELPPRRSVQCFALAPDGRHVVAGLRPEGDDPKARPEVAVWDAATGTLLHTVDPDLGSLSRITFGPGGRAFAVIGERGLALRTLDGRESWRRKGANTIDAAYPLPDGRWLIYSLSVNETLTRLEVVGGANGEVRGAWPVRPECVGPGAVSPDSRLFCAAGTGRLRLWSIDDGKEVLPSVGHTAAVCTTCVTPDGRFIASTDFRDNEVLLWEVATGRNVRRFRGHAAGCIEIVMSPDGRLLASSSYDRTVRVWEVATGKQLYKIGGFPAPIWHLRFLPDSETLAVAPFSGQGVSVYHCPTGKTVHELPMPAGFRPSAVLRHPDGRILMIDSATNGQGGATVQVWDVMASRLVRRFDGHRGQLVGTALSPDGRTLATRGDDGWLRLWELVSSQIRAGLYEEKPAGSTGTQFFAFSPDGRTIASANRREPRVYLWDVPSGRQFASFAAHERPMYNVEYTPDGRGLLTGSLDATLLAWDMTAPDKRSRPLPSGRLTKEQQEKDWAKLRDGTAAEAYRAKWVLAGDPDATVAFLRGRFAPPRPVRPEQIKSWLAELESPKYATREAAERRLLAAFDQAETELHKALPNAAVEARRRITRILDTTSMAAPPPDLLRELRAVEVLDQIGTRPALDLLRGLTPDKVRARVAAEAAATLKRLDRPRE